MNAHEPQESKNPENPKELMELSPEALVEVVLQQRNVNLQADDCGCGDSCTD